MADNERVVLLGTVQERQSVDDTSPFACKAGGSPAWYDCSAPPPQVDSLVCPNCSKPLFLVTQVYAPVDTDRTLYVFGCNSVACTETPGSWRVLRDESVATVAAAATAAPTPTTTMPGNTATQEGLSNAWGAGSDSDSSDWGDNDDDDDDSTDPFATTSTDADDVTIDLEQLLLQRDDAMSAATNPVATKTNKPNKATGDNRSSPAATASVPLLPTRSTHVFPAKPIDVVDEPFEDYSVENDYSHEQALLEDYMKQEDADKSTDVHDLRKILSSVSDSNSSPSVRNSSAESYEKTPAQQRHFLRFQKRIARCPLQCLRYDYGGVPLWPLPTPRGLKVPACNCGADRVFELQLTPTLLYFLKVDEFVSGNSPVANRDAAGVEATPPVALKSAGTAMDWMGVLVYSCPTSCAHSREEFVYVLPAEKA